MADIGQKIDERGFQIASGVVFGVALLLSIARMSIKVTRFGKLFADDYFFLAAVVFLIVGTTMVYLALPFVQTGIYVAAGVVRPPPDAGYQLDLATKYQDAGVLLLNAAIYAVKFSFLFFFRLLLSGTGKLQVWWWCVVIFTIPSAVVCMCTNFMVCPTFGDKIREVCLSESALPRQYAALYTVVVLDILTDVLLISLPILILWSVRINWRRKFALGTLLCLSILAIVTNIIRAAGHKLYNGQDDVVWVLFWIEIEGCVAVIANSMTAFRSIFAGKSTSTPRNRHSSSSETSRRRLMLRRRRQQQQQQEQGKPRIEMPTLTGATLSGIKSFLLKDPFEESDQQTIESDERTLAAPGSSGSENNTNTDVSNSFAPRSSDVGQSTHRDYHEKKPSLGGSNLV